MKLILALLLGFLATINDSAIILQEYKMDDDHHDLQLLAFDPQKNLKIVRRKKITFIKIVHNYILRESMFQMEVKMKYQKSYNQKLSNQL